MQELERKNAVIDTDFLVHIAGINAVDPVILLDGYRADAGYDLLMHELVYQNEIHGFERLITPFFEKGIVECFQFIDAMKDHERAMYSQYVREIYGQIKGEKFPECDVLTWWKSGISLGEIHEISLCLMHSFSILLSDDGEAKNIAIIAKKISNQSNIQVLNRKDAYKQIESTSRMTRPESRAFKREIKDN